ncbi:MAG: peptidase M50 [Chloroflexaceae bacterium]
MRNILSPPDERALSGDTDDNIELLKAWAGTSLAFAIFMVGGQVLQPGFVTFLIIAAITCGIGFLLHELAHRILARNYGAEAHFVANNPWLLLSVVIAFAGIFIAAPGAVWHRGYLTKRQGGMIALAGPATNLALAVLFLLLSFAIPAGGFLAIMAFVGYQINAWLGLFNMIPAGPFDGAKVLNWSPVVFGVTVAIAVILVFVLPRMVF